MKKIIIAVSLAFVVTTGICIYSDNMQSEIAQNVLRLHILANSDSSEDQALKLTVRDKLLDESRDLFSGCSSPEESKRVFTDEKERLTSVAENTIRNEGFAYPVSLSLEKTYFPTRNYNGISFPAGEYDAVRVEIGNATGKNWWCVMFPPLCFVDGSVSANASAQLTDVIGSDAAILTPASSESVQVKFKVVDFFQSAKHVIKKALFRA